MPQAKKIFAAVPTRDVLTITISSRSSDASPSNPAASTTSQPSLLTAEEGEVPHASNLCPADATGSHLTPFARSYPTPGEKRKRELIRMGHTLSYFLRHGAIQEGGQMAPDGSVSMTEMLEILTKRFPSTPPWTHNSIIEIMYHDQRDRFQLFMTSNHGVDNEYRIRAQQGHSIRGVIEERLIFKQIVLPGWRRYPTVVHGTSPGAWSLINIEGRLRSFNRLHIHFSQSVEKLNKKKTIVLFINLHQALKAGYLFYLARNGVILCKGSGEDPTGSEATLPIRFIIKAVHRKDLPRPRRDVLNKVLSNIN